MTIQEKLLLSGVRQQERVCGKWLIVGSTGVKLFGEFEEVEPDTIDSDYGPDPREGSFFNFRRPGPELAVGETLIDGTVQWEVLQDKEDHPYKPRIRYKVQKVL